MHTPDLRSERGIALAISVFALVIIGALVAGTFFAGRLERSSGQNSAYQIQAFQAAEAGVATVVNNWLPSTYNNQAEGDDVDVLTTSLGGGGQEFTTTVTKLNSNLFLVRAEGRRVAGATVLARRMVGQLVRTQIPLVDITAAVTVYGGLTVGGSAEIDGSDHVPGGWGGSCPAAGAPESGIRSNDDNINTNGNNCADLDCVTGDPQLEVDPTLTPDDFTNFGDMTFDDLAAQATKVVTGTLTGIHPDSLAPAFGLPLGTPGTCNTGATLNWGEPYTGAGSVPPCFEYFPVIYAEGDLHLSGGRGQGILLVRGNLQLSGGVEFFGPVIVLGDVRSTGTGGHVYGGLMARNAELDPTVITGNSIVNFSRCAVARALNAASGVRPLASRSWAQLY